MEQLAIHLADEAVTREMFWDTPDNERLVLKFSAPMNWDEFDAGVKQAHALCGTLQQPVDLVVIAQTAMPDGLALPHLTTAFRSQPRNVTRLIIIVEKPSNLSALIVELASIIRRLFPQQSPIFFVHSLNEARNLAR